MSVTFVTTLPFRLLQFVIGIAAVESLSSHFIGAGHCPSNSAASPTISGSRRSAVLQFVPTASTTSSATTTTYRKRQSILFSSRQPYEEADDDGYDDFRPSQQPKFSETSKEEIRLRRMAKNTPKNEFPRKSNEDFEDDDFYAEEGDRGRRERNGSRLATYDNSLDENLDYEDDFYDDDEDDDEDFGEEEPVGGNFWSNPTSRVDNPPARGRQRQQRRYDDSNDDIRRRPRRPREQQDDRQRAPPARRRAAPRSGLGEPPKVFKEFYNQFFWYGFDADEIAEVGDNNVFGGTKGKFNGFNYLLAEAEQGQNERKNTRSRPSNNSVGRLPPSRNGSGGAMTRDYEKRIRRDVGDDYYDGDDDIDDYSDDDRDYDRVDDSRSKTSSSYTPPTDRTSTTRYDSVDDYDAYENDDDYDEFTDNRRMGRKNSARYDDDEDENMDRRSGGRRRRRQQSGSSAPDWSPLNMIESFLGIDREEMNYKADDYNAKMGLGKRKRSSSLSLSEEEEPGRGRNSRRRPLPQRRRSARDDPERSGYAYRYDANLDDDESTPILDIDLAADEEDSESMNSVSSKRRRQLSLDVDDNDETTKKSKQTTERSWEERQIAMERVPPLDIKAWGPSGELPMSAREKAFVDAQEDIETARRKLNVMKKKESVAKEEITILKVDAERQRLKLSDSSPERRSRRDVEELRQIELDIDDASRELRTSRTKADRALGKLEELEERHHAIMSCYNIDQASLLVGDSLNQFSASIQGKSASTSTSTSSTTNNASTTNISDDIVSSNKTDDSKSDSIQN